MLIKQREKLFDLEPPQGLKFIYVEGKGIGVFTDREFRAGEDIISFVNTLVGAEHKSAEAVQVDENQYLDTEWLVTEAFVNHSCDPNARLDFRPGEPESAYVAIRDIAKNEEITFNYCATEYDMGEGFECRCGAEHCYGRVRGFRYLTREQQEKLRPLLLSYLIAKIQ